MMRSILPFFFTRKDISEFSEIRHTRWPMLALVMNFANSSLTSNDAPPSEKLRSMHKITLSLKKKTLQD